MTLREALEGVPDPRDRRKVRHPLGAMLALSVCAMLCGARSLYAISQWGRDHGAWIAEALGFPRGQTPSVATLHRVFTRIDREAFEGVVGQWLCTAGLKPGEAIAVDGKTLRGIHGEEVPGVHLVAAFAHDTGIVPGQQGVGEKESELGALRKLLERVPVAGHVVTGDAQFAQRADAATIVAKGGATSSSSRTISPP